MRFEKKVILICEMKYADLFVQLIWHIDNYQNRPKNLYQCIDHMI